MLNTRVINQFDAEQIALDSLAADSAELLELVSGDVWSVFSRTFINTYIHMFLDANFTRTTDEETGYALYQTFRTYDDGDKLPWND